MSMSPGQRLFRRVGFTLIELLVVIAIIALLIAVLMPALASAKAASRSAQCMSNQRQIAIAIRSYVVESREYWPVASYVMCGNGPPPTPDTGLDHAPHDSATWAGVVAYYGNNPYTTDYGTNWTKYPGVVRYVGVYGVGSPRQGILKCPSETFVDYWSDGPVAVSYGYSSGYNTWGMGTNDTFTYDYPIMYPGSGWEYANGRVRSQQVRQESRTLLTADMEQPGGYEYLAYQFSVANGYAGYANYHPGQSANALFVDGHVTSVRRTESTGKEFDRRRID